jgi:hypothetical protein
LPDRGAHNPANATIANTLRFMVFMDIFCLCLNRKDLGDRRAVGAMQPILYPRRRDLIGEE